MNWRAFFGLDQSPVPGPQSRPVTVRPPASRSYAAGRFDRLTASFGSSSPQSADAAIRYSLPLMRNRSRELAENNDYVAGYLELLGNKIIGPGGIRLQVKSVGGDGKLDRAANAAIESAWHQWGRRGSCDITGRLSWQELQRLSLVSMARDGEIFIRLLRAPGVNRFKLALQPLEADMVDIVRNDTLSNGNTIRMGVELDPYEKPVAYHVFEYHPGDAGLGRTAGRTMRVPASEMIHVFRQQRPGQTRGVPWTSAIMTRIDHLGKYEEAALVNARMGAAKMGFFTRQEGSGEYTGDGTDDSGATVSEVEPGQMETLPIGYDFKSFDPTYPANEYDAFVKRQLKGSSCGLPGATYADLSNDLESVNFSSIRQGTLNARDSYRDIQRLLIDVLCVPVYEAWLTNALTWELITIITGKQGPNPALKAINYAKYNVPVFIGRGWEWVDPLKDQAANTEGLLNRTTTRTRIAAEQGEDIEDIFAELQQESELATTYGITLEQPVKPVLPPEPPQGA